MGRLPRSGHTIFGGKAALAGLWVPDDDVAAYTKSHADKAIGFLSLDPSQPGWQDELHHGHRDLKLKGIKLMPMYAGFYPNDRKFDYLWEYATSHWLPVLLHTGTAPGIAVTKLVGRGTCVCPMSAAADVG